MDAHGEDLPRCYFHPEQVVVGICSLCLGERLLNLASKDGHQPQAKDTHRSLQVLRGKLAIYLPRFHAVSSILHRLKFGQRRTNESFDEGSISGQDSFISMEFDGDRHPPHGDERSSAKASLLELVDSATSHQALPRGNMEYVKQTGIPRWRKRIGGLLKMAKWKGSPRPGTCKERTQGRKGWTRRTASE
ncbi:hypothetical protein COCNU_02G010490 [Cocos nucifera]|uniref:Uncharacterized protein n=1 Tax=Cocos nucifera TaxID=13894 RepID=A0A8K0HZA8_COCNU|nr:hypothetical protein COCNU_02G010490 [Cocos nucifera]